MVIFWIVIFILGNRWAVEGFQIISLSFYKWLTIISDLVVLLNSMRLGWRMMLWLLKASWKVFDVNSGLSFATQFASNLKIIKEVSITWSIKKKEQDNKDLVDIEALLVTSAHSLGFGFLTVEDKVSLADLESKKRKILSEREQEARQKCRGLWLLCGDDDTLFFHNFANNRKFVNTILCKFES